MLSGIPKIVSTKLSASALVFPFFISACDNDVKGLTTEEFASEMIDPSNGKLVDVSIPPSTIIDPSSGSKEPFSFLSTLRNSSIVKSNEKVPFELVNVSCDKSDNPSPSISKITLAPERYPSIASPFNTTVLLTI